MQPSAALDGEQTAQAHRAEKNEFIWALLAAALATATAAAVLLLTPRYFFNDDYTTQFVPVFSEIARLLGQGHFPLITDRIWQGGALVQEYQYAVFNPFSMVLYVALNGLDDLATFAAVFSLIHIFILAAGAYFVCRVLGAARRHAFLAAVLTPLSDWIFFWDRSTGYRAWSAWPGRCGRGACWS